MTNSNKHQDTGLTFHPEETNSRNPKLDLSKFPRPWKRSIGSSTFVVCCSVLSLLLVVSPVVRAEMVMGVENDDFDFDGLPGAMHEFKVFVEAGAEDCFFQNVAEGAQFYTKFEVLKGGNKMVDLTIRDWTGAVIEAETGTKGHISVKNATAGVYALCIDNVLERYGYKVVYVYMITIVMREWLQYHAEFAKVQVIAANFSESLATVETSIAEMKQSQAAARFYVVRDWYQVMGNLYYVGMYSMIQCGLIILAAIAQVYSLRRLFRTSTTTPTAKPRA